MKKEGEAKEIFETMPVAKAFRTVAVLTIIGQIIVLIYNVADTFYVGRTNAFFWMPSSSCTESCSLRLQLIF